MSTLVAIVGPTASGKSDFALDLADALGGPPSVEIIGADAMQLYRGMDVGTAKVPQGERRGIQHHQIDVIDIHEDASVAAYQKHAREDASTIMGAGKTPVVVGGSGLYLRALLDKMEFPGTDPKVRARLEDELVTEGAASLHARLESLDPKAAERIDPRNGRRTVRALEVIEITGKPFSASLPEYRYHQPAVQIGISLPVEVLDQKIAARTQRMFELGLVEEVQGLAKMGLADTKTASRATGYRQVLDMLDGEISEEDAKEAIALATRQLARRQIKWFRRDPRITWVDPRDEDSLGRVLQTIRDPQNAEAFL